MTEAATYSAGAKNFAALVSSFATSFAFLLASAFVEVGAKYGAIS